MRNIKLVLEYDGTDFVGWQTQENGRSVQGEIAKILTRVLQEDINLIGAGRTDSGVHAKGQVANFRTSCTYSSEDILRILNGVLPRDIALRSAEDVPEHFHARYDARGRMYRYYIHQTTFAIGRQYSWFVKYDLDLNAMNTVAQEILGEHDFKSFCKSSSEVDDCRCHITRSMWREMGPGTSWRHGAIGYEICANRFVHGMVRALVGTMIDIGRGHTPASAFRDMMSAKDRRNTGMAAPAHGLFLEEVLY
jgi:tRNA pseudouridine38-40 synthase